MVLWTAYLETLSNNGWCNFQAHQVSTLTVQAASSYRIDSTLTVQATPSDRKESTLIVHLAAQKQYNTAETKWNYVWQAKLETQWDSETIIGPPISKRTAPKNQITQRSPQSKLTQWDSETIIGPPIIKRTAPKNQITQWSPQSKLTVLSPTNQDWCWAWQFYQVWKSCHNQIISDRQSKRR